jgi:carbonic anhydrase/acetyltransferase-like protein (isoleucine patch superfamily)
MADEEQQQENSEQHAVVAGADGAAALRGPVEGGMRLHFSFDIPGLPKIDTFPHWSHQALINAGLISAVALMAMFWAYGRFFAGDGVATPSADATQAEEAAGPILANAVSDYNPTVDMPEVVAGAFVHDRAQVVGHVAIGAGSFVGPNAVIDSWAGQPMHIGSDVNIQSGVILSSRPTFVRGRIDENAHVQVEGERFAIFVGDGVSVAPGAQITGPSHVEAGAYIGHGAMVIEANIGAGVVVEAGAVVVGVSIPAGRYVPATTTVLTQAEADALPAIDSTYAMATAGKDSVEFFTALAAAFSGQESSSHSPATSATGTSQDEAATSEVVAEDSNAGTDTGSADE